MSSPQEQYAESLRASQEAAMQAVESWTKTAQSAFSAPTSSASAQLDPNQVIDQVFQFAEQMLQVQREFAKTLAATAVSAGEAAREQAEAAGDALRQQGEAATDAVRKQSKSAGKGKKASS